MGDPTIQFTIRDSEGTKKMSFKVKASVAFSKVLPFLYEKWHVAKKTAKFTVDGMRIRVERSVAANHIVAGSEVIMILDQHGG